MSDTIQPEQISEPLRKSDIPWYYSGIIMRVFAFGMPVSIIIGMFVDPAFRELRPGILDGILSGFVGILAGWIAGKFSVSGHEELMIEHKQREKLCRLRGLLKHDIVTIPLFFGTLACSALIWFNFNKLGLDWPLVSKNPTFIPVFTFTGAMYYRYAKWYDNLPD